MDFSKIAQHRTIMFDCASLPFLYIFISKLVALNRNPMVNSFLKVFCMAKCQHSTYFSIPNNRKIISLHEGISLPTASYFHMPPIGSKCYHLAFSIWFHISLVALEEF